MRQDEIPIAIVVEIDEQAGQRPLQKIDTRIARPVVEDAVGSLHVQTVR